MTTNPNLLEPLGRFRTDLVVEPQKKDGATGAYLVLDSTSNVSHLLTELEYAVATCMDGARNAIDVARHAARLGHPVQADHVERFHRELEGLSFVYRDQPPPLTRAPDLSHRDDAKRFVEEAKRELALGRIEVARDLLDAALAIDRVAATNAATGGLPATPSTTPVKPTPPLTGDALGAVLDYLKDWNVAAPPAGAASQGGTGVPPVMPATFAPGDMSALSDMPPLATSSPAPQTGATARWTPPTFEALAPIDINLDDAAAAPVAANDAAAATIRAPRSPRRATRWFAAAAAIMLVGVGVGASMGFTTLSSDLLAFPEALASTPMPAAAGAPSSSVVTPPVAPSSPVVTPPLAPVAPTVDRVADAILADTVVLAEAVAAPPVNNSDTDVVAPVKGKFTRALVSSGLKVKAGQRIAMLTALTGKQTVITAPSAGIFEATLALGKTVGKGEVVGVVHAW